MNITIKHGQDTETAVLVDGNNIADSLSALSVEIGSKGVTTVRLELIGVSTLSLDLSDPDVRLDPITTMALRVLGWIPPETSKAIGDPDMKSEQG